VLAKRGIAEMPAKLYRVDLTKEERRELEGLTRKGKVSARKMKRAQILLKADEGWRDEDIISAVEVGHSTVERTRQRFVEGGVAKALNEDTRPGQVRKLDGRGEAQLIAMVCSQQPESQARWTLRLLADRLVQLGVVEDISHETVRQVLKKTNLSRGK
jgi:transposase